MKCKNCQQELSSNAKNCPNCGARVQDGCLVVASILLAVVCWIVAAPLAFLGGCFVLMGQGELYSAAVGAALIGISIVLIWFSIVIFKK